MAEQEKSGLHIDTDWKKQAQEEKRKLAEDEQKRSAAAAASSTAPVPGGAGVSAGRPAPEGSPGRGRPGSPGTRGERVMPEASFPTLINTFVTQVLLYLGDLAPRGTEPQVNLDLAKFNIDLLGVVEEKAKGNLSPDEQKMLDSALYEVRMRYVAVASQYATV